MDFLKTIKDFDFGAPISDLRETARVADVNEDVKDSDVQLIFWLILEHELGLVERERGPRRSSRTQTDGGRGGGVRQNRNSGSESGYQGSSSEDNVDSLFQTQDQHQSTGSGFRFNRHVRVRTESVSQGKQRKHAEDLLRQCGVALPLNQLSGAERKEIFQQFSASSELLRGQKFGSVVELYQALKAKSKFENEFCVVELLGTGNYGDVYAVINQRTGAKYAAKRTSLTIDNAEDMKLTLSESKILKSLNHSNIVQCHDAWLEMDYNSNPTNNSEDDQEPLKFYVLMDYCHKSLNQWIGESEHKPTADKVMIIFSDVINALEFVHSRRILHLDINSNNILWADANQTSVKVGDFGLAIKGDFFPDRSGSVPYAAPEEVFTNKSDVYSFGVTLLEVAEKVATMNELHKRLLEQKFECEISFVNEFLPRLLAKNPNVRPTFSELKGILITMNWIHKNKITSDNQNHPANRPFTT